MVFVCVFQGQRPKNILVIVKKLKKKKKKTLNVCQDPFWNFRKKCRFV